MASAAKKVEPIGTIIQGALLAVIGVVVLGLSWPHLEVGFSGDVESKGSTAGLIIGGVLLLVGQVLLLIGVIAQGVWLGRLKYAQEIEARPAAPVAAAAVAANVATPAPSDCKHSRTAHGAGARGGTLCLDCGTTL